MDSRPVKSVLQAARLRVRSVLAVIGALTVVVVLFLLFRGWQMSGRHQAVPAGLQVEAHIGSFPDEVRYFPRDPGDIKLIEKEFADSWDREKAFLHREELPPTLTAALRAQRRSRSLTGSSAR